MRPIVFGFDSYNTAGSIRCLGEAGFSPVLILVSDRKRPAAQRSKYLSRVINVETVEDGLKYLDVLSDPHIKTQVFVTSDKIATALDQQYSRFSANFIFPNTGIQGGLTKAMDKDFQCRLANENGLNIPYSITYHKGDPIPEKIPYPCLIKPLKSIEGRKQDIKTIASNQELREYLSNVSCTSDFLIQQFIDKDYEVLLIGCRTPKGNVYAPAYHKKTRYVGEGDGSSYGVVNKFSDYGTAQDVLFNKKNVENFLNALNYVGPFSIEYGVKDGTAYFFEINLRNDGTIHYYTEVGVNVPETYLLDKDTTDSTKNDSAIFIDEFGDILNVINGHLTVGEWLKSLKKATVFKYYDNKDKGPFRGFAPRMTRVIISTLLRKVLCRN